MKGFFGCGEQVAQTLKLSGSAQQLDDLVRIGDASCLGFGIGQTAVDPDVEGAFGAGFQSDVGVQFAAKPVRKTCGAGGIARSEAAVGDEHEHGRSSVSVGLVNTGNIPYA